jgi:outer membrane protein TolC
MVTCSRISRGGRDAIGFELGSAGPGRRHDRRLRRGARLCRAAVGGVRRRSSARGAVAQRRRRPRPLDQAAWWKGFNDPVLDGLVDRALAQNLDLAQATARVTQARAGLSAATAALLPSGGVQASAAKSYASTQTPIGRLASAAPSFDRDGSLYEADVTGGWEIDVFGGLRRDREAAVADYQAARVGVAAARLSVAAQTADTYLVIRGLQARLAVARGQVETQSDWSRPCACNRAARSPPNFNCIRPRAPWPRPRPRFRCWRRDSRRR